MEDETLEHLQRECPICFDKLITQEMVTMVNCGHEMCKDCFKLYFKQVIQDKSVELFNCPICGELDLSQREDDELCMYFAMLLQLIDDHLDRNSYFSCDKMIRDFQLSKLPNFCCCASDNCDAGFFGEEGQKKAQCPECRKYMCFQCKRPWEKQHEGISCEEFSDWKLENDPELQQAGLAAYLTVNGIDILQRALKEGSVDLKIMKCLVQGPARVGKTHVKALIMKKKLDKDKSPSTNCVEQAVRAVCTEKFAENDESWEEVDADELMKMLTNELKCQKEKLPPCQNKWPEEKFNITPDDDSISESLASSHSEQVDMPDEIEADREVNIVEELQSLIASCEDVALHQKWIYVVDSGGQPQFHNVFQAFVNNTSILLLVFSLAEELSVFNTYRFQDSDGHDISTSAGSSAARVSDILKSIASTLNSTDAEEERKIKLFFVGTFKDLYEKKPRDFESIEEKEQLLCEMFDRSNIQGTSSRINTSVIFPVDGLQAERGEFDDEVVCDIRQQILDCFKEIKEKPIPLKWFFFHLKLDAKAASLKRKVLTYREYTSIAKAVQIEGVEVHVALEFLDECSLLLFYPELDLVFTDPQVLLNVFSALIIAFNTGKISGSMEVLENFKKAIISSSIFSKLLQISSEEKDILTCEKLLKIFQHLLIVAEIDEDKYFIPALLPSENKEDIRNESLSVESSMVPLLFLFSDKCTPSGLFCAVVVKLLAKGWTVDLKEKVYCNKVSLIYKKIKPNLAICLTDSFKYFEVYCSRENNLPEIQKEMEDVIKSVIISRKYKCKRPKIAFFCSCSECKIATVEENGDLCCCHKSYSPEEMEQERKWIQGAVGATCSVSASKATYSARTTVSTTPLTISFCDRPQLHQLHWLEGHGSQVVKVMETVAPVWEDLALALQFSGSCIATIERDSLRQAKTACRMSLQQWLQGKEGARRPISWQTLVDCLREMELTDSVTDLLSP